MLVQQGQPGQAVAPLAGAWIETTAWSECRAGLSSPPSRGRGLKLPFRLATLVKNPVAPLAGAWIETGRWTGLRAGPRVAPLAGAWIETEIEQACIATVARRPPRGGVD